MLGVRRRLRSADRRSRRFLVIRLVALDGRAVVVFSRWHAVQRFVDRFIKLVEEINVGLFCTLIGLIDGRSICADRLLRCLGGRPWMKLIVTR
jgi:hypothetical protein